LGSPEVVTPFASQGSAGSQKDSNKSGGTREVCWEYTKKKKGMDMNMYIYI